MLRRTTKRIINNINLKLYRAGLRSVKNLSLPTFIGLGTGQSGTTWLFEHLSKHPDVVMPKRKEVHYFDQQFDQWPLAYYASLFDHPTKTVRGECSPGYSILPIEYIRMISELMPDLKLILILRNPVERSWSGLRRLVAKQNRTIDQYDDTTLLQVLDQEWMYKGDQFPPLRGNFSLGLLEGYYTQSIDNWLSVFPCEQLLVTFFDNLKHSPAQFLTDVCQHIGVDSAPLLDSTSLRQKVNANPASVIPPQYEQFLINKYSEEIRRLQQRYGGPTLAWQTTYS